LAARAPAVLAPGAGWTRRDHGLRIERGRQAAGRGAAARSEERRVGKEAGWGCSPRHRKATQCQCRGGDTLNQAGRDRTSASDCCRVRKVIVSGLGTHFHASFLFSSRRRRTRSNRDWSSDVCSSDLWLRERRRFWLPALAGLGVITAYGLSEAVKLLVEEPR